MTAPALFELTADNEWTATEYSRGPWHPDFCHGGPIAALLTRAVEHFDDHPWELAQSHIELTRPVPVGRPLRLDTALDRPGRKVSVVTTVLSDRDVVVARSRGVRIRHVELPLPDGLSSADTPLPGPDTALIQHLEWDAVTDTAFHSHSNEFRVAEGSLVDRGPVGVWIRLNVPLLPDEVLTGTQRLAAAADFPNGVSSSLPAEQFSFINPGLSVSSVRAPRGEWIGLRAVTHYGDPDRGTGVAFAEAELYDLDGRVGRATQSLLIDAAG